MIIDKLSLTIPQRHLMEIFAETHNIGPYGDQCARALLTYLQSLLAEAGYSSPTLDRMLAGTLPPLNFDRFFNQVMCSVYDCDREYWLSPSVIPLQEYQDALLNCFPKVFHDLFPQPTESIDPAKNLLVTWEMWYGDKIVEELDNVKDDDLRGILSLINRYIRVCAAGWPAFHQFFLSWWTHYLLTREWPDDGEIFKAKWQAEEEFRKSCQKTLSLTLQENQQLKSAMEGHYITVMEAARAVLRSLYGQDKVEKETDAWRKRVMACGEDLGVPIEGRQGRKYYPVENVIAAFQTTNRESITDEDIADAIHAKSLAKARLKL